MSGRIDAITPVSVEGSEWSGISKYHSAQSPDHLPQQRLAQQPYPPPALNPRAAAAMTTTVPNGANGVHTNDSGPAAPGLSARRPGDTSTNPSPPSSVARSSDGSGLPVLTDEALAEHYVALKRFLAPFLRDERANPRSNRAKDKLLRLSPVQFHELSTDVFDELLRRQSASGARRSGPEGVVQEGAPPFLLPEDNFHPRRNQARQKLSTLPASRFRDLSTDVFYELERRFPKFSAVEPDRVVSSASTHRGSTGKVSLGRVGPAPSVRGHNLSNLSMSEAYSRGEMSNGGDSSTIVEGSDYSRPLPKTFQSNVIVPNKSTMIEDDEDNSSPGDAAESNEPYGRRQSKRTTLKSANGPEAYRKSTTEAQAQRKSLADPQAQVRQLQEKIMQLEDRLRDRDEEYSRLQASSAARDRAAENERREWTALQTDMEMKLSEAQSLNKSMQAELDKLRSVNSSLEKDMQALRMRPNGALTDDEAARDAGAEWKAQYENLERRYEELKLDLQDQQNITEEMRREASESLMEMKALSDRCGQSWERDEALVNRIVRLEQEVKDWKHHYARVRTQLRSLRASSIGPSIKPKDVTVYARDNSVVSADGRIKDVHITKFQIAIDELLRIARVEDGPAVLDAMKAVVAATRHVIKDVAAGGGADGVAPDDATKLKLRVASHTNQLITVANNFAAAGGISPVALLDAAASHLSAAVVDLIHVAKIRPSPVGELEDEDDAEREDDGFAHDEFTSAPLPLENGTVRRESIYSRTRGSVDAGKLMH